MPAPAARRRCSSFQKPANCASMSTFRRTTCLTSRSAPRRKSRCPNILAGRFRQPSKRRRRRSTSRPTPTRIQLVVDNSQGELMTGDFTNVNFELPHPEVAINVPASALIFNQSGLHVATVGNDGRIVLKKVTIARDLGNEVEIGSGIVADDRVVINPPDGIATGDKVRIAGAPGKSGEPETAEAK